MTRETDGRGVLPPSLAPGMPGREGERRARPMCAAASIREGGNQEREWRCCLELKIVSGRRERCLSLDTAQVALCLALPVPPLLSSSPAAHSGSPSPPPPPALPLRFSGSWPAQFPPSCPPPPPRTASRSRDRAAPSPFIPPYFPPGAPSSPHLSLGGAAAVSQTEEGGEEWG